MNVRADNIICRLCFKLPRNELVFIDEVTRQGLDILLVRMNFDVSSEPLMCEDCMKIIKTLLSFVLACLNSEKQILLFNTVENKVSIDLRDVYAYNSKQIVLEDSCICRFCINKIEERNCVPLDVLMRENMSLYMLKKYMFQMDQKVKNPSICFHCRNNIEGYSKFLLMCRDTEEKINTYRLNEGTRRGEKIVLSNAFEQLSKSTMGYLNRRTQSKVKIEVLPLTEDVKREEELHIKDEVTLSEGPHQETGIHNKKSIYKCHLCPYQSSRANSHMLRHLDVSEVTMYKCTVKYCAFKTKYNKSLKRHSLAHKTEAEVVMYKCKACKFKTKYKNNLKSHLLTHKAKAAVEVYKCTACDYETIRKDILKSHSLGHITGVEIKVYKCALCGFETIRKENLKMHSLTHKSKAEVMMYNCMACDFKTMRKNSLKRHSLIHKSETELTLYECAVCDLKTIHKGSLKRHLLTHEIKKDLTMYK